jgi:cobalt-zinc-cadmium efflux system outer membrane protein
MRIMSLLLLGVAIVGCRSSGRDQLEAPVVSAKTPAEAASPKGGEPDEAPSVQPQRLSLAEVRARVFEKANLKLAAEAIRTAEAEGRAEEAALWPNPRVLVRKRRIEDFEVIDTGFLEVEFWQPFELGGKRGARTEQALAEVAAVSEAVRALTVATLRDAEAQFYRVLRLERDVAEAQEEAKAAADLAALTASREKAGKASRIAVLRFQAAAETTRLTVQDLEREHARACRRLDDLLGLAATTTAGVTGDFEGAQLTGFDRKAARAALESHPRRLAAKKAAIAADRAIESAAADAWPDLSLAVGYERSVDLDQNYLGIGLNLPLPLWDRNQGRRAEARAALRRARKSLDAEILTLSVELEAALIAYERSERNAVGYAEEVIPKLAESLRLTRSAYEAGRVSYLDVLDALLALIRARRARLDHLEDQALAAVEIRYLTGVAE